MNKPLRIVGYVVLGLVSFVFFLYWTFPYERLKDRVVTTLDQALQGNIGITIGALSPSVFSGLALEGVTLIDRAAKEKEHQALLTIDEATVNIGILSSLLGSPKASFAVELAGGEIDGDFSQRDDVNVVAAEIDGLQLDQLPLLEAMTGLKLKGGMSGTIDLQVNPKQIKAAKGRVKMSLEDWRTQKGSKLKLGALGEIDLGTNYTLTKSEGSSFDVELDRGTMQIKGFQLKGGDLEIQLTGQIFLEQKFPNSRCNLKGSIKLSEKMQEIIPVAMLGPASPDDGSYPIELSGRLDQLRKRIGNFNF